MSKQYIWLRMTKEWGGFRIGEIVRFGYNKGQGRITNGEGVEVPEPKAEKVSAPQIERKPVVETATAEPVSEKAVVTPQRKSKKDLKTDKD